jgi:hypothetical protein
MPIDIVGEFVPLQIQLLDEYAEADDAMLDARETRFSRLDRAGRLIEERNEHQAVLEALPDLLRLDRYERRAWSRQKRAIRNFMRIKSVREAEGQRSTGLAITRSQASSEKGSEIPAGQ